MKQLLRELVCTVIQHDDETVPGTDDLAHGAEMKRCNRCGRIGWVVFG